MILAKYKKSWFLENLVSGNYYGSQGGFLASTVSHTMVKMNLAAGGGGAFTCTVHPQLLSGPCLSGTSIIQQVH